MKGHLLVLQEAFFEHGGSKKLLSAKGRYVIPLSLMLFDRYEDKFEFLHNQTWRRARQRMIIVVRDMQLQNA